MKLNPGSFGLALAVNGAIMAGLIYSVPDIVKIADHGLTIVQIKAPPIPPEIKPLPKETQPEVKTVPTFLPKQVVETDSAHDVIFDSQPDITAKVNEGADIGEVLPPVPIKPTPIVVGPQINSSFNYQPDYPSDERRLGHEGRVVVRVLIGVDGRVKEVEKVSAASDSFFEATRRRALEKWRLKPGTRDGVPIEAWRTMSVSFVMNDE